MQFRGTFFINRFIKISKLRYVITKHKVVVFEGYVNLFIEYVTSIIYDANLWPAKFAYTNVKGSFFIQVFRKGSR